MTVTCLTNGILAKSGKWRVFAVIARNIRKTLFLPVGFGLLNTVFAEGHEVPVNVRHDRPVLSAKKYDP